MNTSLCLTCHQPFDQTRLWKKFCSKPCQIKHWQQKQSAFKKQMSQYFDDPTQEKSLISHSTFPRKLRYGCFVYGFYRRGKYLYIGSCIKLMARMPNHHIIGVSFPIYTSDYLNLWNATSENRVDLEAALVQLHEPPFNSNSPSQLNSIRIGDPDYSIPLTIPQCVQCLKPLDFSRGAHSHLGDFCNAICRFNYIKQHGSYDSYA